MRYPTIDQAKGVAIIGVVLQHTLNRDFFINAFFYLFGFSFTFNLNSAKGYGGEILSSTLYLTIDQAVPIFIVLMGLNAALSLSNPKPGHYLKRIRRFVIPAAIIFAASLLYGFYIGNYYLGWKNLLWEMPVLVLGDWFVSVAIQFALIAPFLYAAYKRWPTFTIIGAFIIGVVLHALYITYQDSIFSAIYCRSFLIVLFGTILGISLCDDLVKNSRIDIFKHKYILAIMPISILLTVLTPWIAWGHWCVLTFFYSTFLVIMLINLPWSSKTLENIGKASYHILLIQGIWFGWGLFLSRYASMNPHLAPVYMLADLLFSIIGGLVFYWVDVSMLKFPLQLPDKLQLSWLR